MLLAIDQGTTGTTCLVFDLQGELHRPRLPRVHPALPEAGLGRARRGGDLGRLARGRRRGAARTRGCEPGELEAIGITNQRETVVCWDPSTGEPLHPALVWQDRRTAARCDELREAGEEDRVRERTGLMLDPYFSATKIEWLLRNVDGLAERARDGRAVFGTVDSWMLFKLTGEHVTEPSNAARTLLLDISQGRRGTRSCSSSSAASRSARCRSCARAAASSGGRAPTPSTASRCRSPAWPATSRPRCSGSAASSPGSARTPTAPARSCSPTRARRCRRAEEGLLATIAWQIGRSTTYAHEAAIFVTGAAVQWLRDGLGIISEAAETEELAASLESNDGVYFVPALTGLGSPHWDPVRARDDRRAHARQRPRAPRARGAGGDGLPDRRRRAGDGPRRARAAGRAARRRRRDRQPLADAVPGRRARRSRSPWPRSRRRRRSARRCSRGSARTCSRSSQVSRARRRAGPLRAAHVRGRARVPARRLAPGARA